LEEAHRGGDKELVECKELAQRTMGEEIR
jgi:hypothetical protein